MRVEFHRRLHRHQRQQLEQVVRHHVAQRAGGIVKTAAVADAEPLVHGDLHVIDMIAIPDRLEHSVGKAQHQNVLHGFLAEIMIDPVDLVLVYQLEQRLVQRARRGEIGAERFFHHQPPPHAVFFQHPGAAKLAADRKKGVGRRREIEQTISPGLARLLQRIELLAHGVERGGVFRVGLDRGDAGEQPLGDGLIHWTRRELAQAFHQVVAEHPRSSCPCARRRPRRIAPARDRRRRGYKGQGSPGGGSGRRSRRR